MRKLLNKNLKQDKDSDNRDNTYVNCFGYSKILCISEIVIGMQTSYIVLFRTSHLCQWVRATGDTAPDMVQGAETGYRANQKGLLDT